MKKISISFFFLVFFSSFAQNRYWINFKDKGTNTLNDIQLSKESLERRQEQGYLLNDTDIPVYKPYIDSLQNLQIKIVTKSRWFNTVSAYLTNQEKQSLQNKNFAFIESITSVNKLKIKKEENSYSTLVNKGTKNSTHYGEAYTAIKQLQAEILHELGFEGEGMHIAVIDAGFSNVDEHPVLEYALENGNIKLGLDFVQNPVVETEYDYSQHGKSVLSTMAGYIPGEYVGTAPKAKYTLIRTEKGSTEDIIEEDFWVMGAEYADSLGVDLINSSLGYSTFDDTLQNHTYQDMDGETTRITKAADIAMDKGILVVTSAGNSGNSDWHYITAPADAKKALTVGAINEFGESAGFSSHGPTYDGRVKPNVVSHGQNIAVAYNSDEVVLSNGTSFSGPVMCGITACLWQYLKNQETGNKKLNNTKIISLLEESASHYTNPDSNVGFGLPNIKSIVKKYSDLSLFNNWVVYPNPFKGTINLRGNFKNKIEIDFTDLTGRTVYKKSIEKSLKYITLDDLDELPNGIYIVRVKDSDDSKVFKILK